MRDSWWKYSFTLLAIALCVGFLYYLSEQKSQLENAHTSSDNESNLDKFKSNLLEFDFYRDLPDKEEASERNGSDDSNQPSPTVEDNDILFQVGAYRDRRDAEHRRAELILLNIPAYLSKSSVKDQIWYRLRVGPVDQEQADKIRQRLHRNRIEYFITRNEPS